MSTYPFKTQEVRDLAWACFSPALLLSEKLVDDSQNIANCDFPLTAQRQRWLEQLDNQPAALHKHLNKRHSVRLGLYFESLWHFFLQHDPGVDLIAHNLPVRHQGRTIGEFDCLYYCLERKRHIHLELAVKYYLSHRQTTNKQQASHWNEWLGPTNTDHLDRKINHLTEHQIQLSEHPYARESLEKLGISSLLKEVELKGYLFQSLGDPLPAPHAHNYHNKLCHWLRIEALENYQNTLQNQHYLILPKPLWLAPAKVQVNNKNLVGRKRLSHLMKEHFAQFDRPQLIAGIDKFGEESTRFFVTGAGWPAHRFHNWIKT